MNRLEDARAILAQFRQSRVLDAARGHEPVRVRVGTDPATGELSIAVHFDRETAPAWLALPESFEASLEGGPRRVPMRTFLVGRTELLVRAEPRQVETRATSQAYGVAGQMIQAVQTGLVGTSGWSFQMGRQLYLLAAGHVIADVDPLPTVTMLQSNGGTFPVVGKTCCGVPLAVDEWNVWDLAFMLYDPSVDVVPRYRPLDPPPVYPMAMNPAPELDASHYLVGENSGFQEGDLLSVGDEFFVKFPDGHRYRFKDQLYFGRADGTAMSAPGDSGSVVASSEGALVTGLAYGRFQDHSGAWITVANPLYRYGLDVIGKGENGLPEIDERRLCSGGS